MGNSLHTGFWLVVTGEWLSGKSSINGATTTTRQRERGVKGGNDEEEKE